VDLLIAIGKVPDSVDFSQIECEVWSNIFTSGPCTLCVAGWS